MKKSFMKLMGLAFAAVAPLAMSAQSVDNPLPLVAGENAYTPTSSGYTYVNYKYSPTEDVLVNMEGTAVYSINDNGTEGNIWYSYDPVKRSMFWAQAGHEYTFSIGTYEEAISFDVTFTPKPYNSGQDKNNPLISELGENFYPCTKDGTGWMAPSLPLYSKFTAPRAGKLTLYGLSHPYDSYLIGNDGSRTELTFNSAEPRGYRCVLQVEEGEELMFEFNNGSPIVLTLTLEDSVPGSGPDEPFKTKTGANEIPAAAGTYWYTFSTPTGSDNIYVILTSECKYPVEILVGGSQSLQGECDVIQLRESFGPGVTRLIKITKEEATADVESFNLKFETPQMYDSFNTAEPISASTVIDTPDFAGVYYYSIESPQTGAWFLDVDSQEGENENVNYYIYDSNNSYSYLAGGKTAHVEVQPSTRYIVKASVPTNVLGTSFSCTFNTIAAGQTAADPLPAVPGENEVPLWKEAYYKYTPEVAGWVVLECKGLVIYSVYENGNYVVCKKYGENSARFEGTAGKTYVIRVDEIEADATLTISQQDYAPGETQDNPLEIGVGQVGIPNIAGKTWYKFTSDETGFINVETDMPYSYTSAVEVYVGEITNINCVSMSTIGSWGAYQYKPLKTGIKAGQSAYICVTSDEPGEGYQLNVYTSPAAPGETIATAIEIPFENGMNYNFTRPDGMAWYSIELPEGLFTLQSEDYFYMYLYNEAGTEQLANSSYKNGNYGLWNAAVENKKYLLCLTNSYDDFSATLTVEEPGPGATPKTAILIENAGNPTIFEKDSQEYGESLWYCMDLNAGTLKWNSPESISGSVYAEGDYSSAIESIGYIWSDPDSADEYYGFYGLEIPAPGRYYFKITQCYFNTQITITGTALETVEDSVETLGAANGEAEYYTLQGVKVANPERGIFIKVAGGKACKVVK